MFWREQVQVIAYLTSPLLKSAVRSQGRPVNITGSVKEKELSAMEPGDVCTLPIFYVLLGVFSCLEEILCFELLPEIALLHKTAFESYLKAVDLLKHFFSFQVRSVT